MHPVLFRLLVICASLRRLRHEGLLRNSHGLSFLFLLKLFARYGDAKLLLGILTLLDLELIVDFDLLRPLQRRVLDPVARFVVDLHR